MFSSLDVTTAECQFPTDKAMILRAVEQQHGSAYAFNTKLKLQLLLEPLSYRCGVCCSMCQKNVTLKPKNLNMFRNWILKATIQAYSLIFLQANLTCQSCKVVVNP